jgi:RNase P subunit RPR2
MEFVATYEQNAEKPPQEWTKTDFSLELPMTVWDRIKPKRCAKCQKIFLTGAKKRITGDMRHTNVNIQYICDRC